MARHLRLNQARLPGPILFKQERYGYKRQIFHAFKFRTMVIGAEKRIDSIKGLNDQNGAFFKSKATRV